MKMYDIETPIGATPLDDYSGLKIEWVKTKEQLDAVEFENINSAFKLFLGQKQYPFPSWYTIEHLNEVHRKMFGDVWQWAGKYRRTEKSIGIQAHRIPIEMSQLQDDLFYWGKEAPLSPIEMVARIHHRLVWIHPYENGNGRHARFIGDMILRSLALPYPNWPVIGDSGSEREKYLRALKDADQHDFDALEDYLCALLPTTHTME